MFSLRDDRSGMRRGSLMVAALVFLLQIVTWAWMPASAMAQPVGSGDGLVICTGDGLIKLLPDGSKVPLEKDGVEGSYHCPLCSLVGSVALPPPPVAVVGSVDEIRHMPQTLPGDQIAAGWFLATLQARAPPRV